MKTHYKPQGWLKELYDNPDLYAGKIISIIDDARIMVIADSFNDAKEKMKMMLPEHSVDQISYFKVPRSFHQILIPTLKICSLRESLWLPFYPVTLRTAHNEISNCQMLIDSGADISLITLKTGQELGLTRSDEEEILPARGIGGEVGYVLRRIQMLIDKNLFGATVAWCQDKSIDEMIIGRKDVFDTFHIEFRQREQQIRFTLADQGESGKK